MLTLATFAASFSGSGPSATDWVSWKKLYSKSYTIAQEEVALASACPTPPLA